MPPFPQLREPLSVVVEYVVVCGFAPPVSLQPAVRIVRRRIAVVMIMVVLVDCMVFSLCCEYLRVVV